MPKRTQHSGGYAQDMNEHYDELQPMEGPEDGALDPVAPNPQDWGFPAKPNRANQECWDHQEAFLAAYRHTSRVRLMRLGLLLLVFEAKAMMPELYREEVKVLNAEAPIRMLEMLKELGKRELEGEQPAALEAPVVEAVYR